MLKRKILMLAAFSLFGCSACSPQAASGQMNASGNAAETAAPDTAQAPPPQITLNMLTDMQAQTGEPDLTFRDESIDSIYGSFLSFPVRNGQDAFQAVASLAELLGIPDVSAEIRLDHCENDGSSDIYSFRQYYQGIPVCNVTLLLLVDPETGRTQFFQNGYQSGLTLDTKPAYPAADAAKAARKALDRRDLAKPVLSVWIGDASPRLAWDITGKDDARTVFAADAKTGSILFEDQIVSE